MEKIGVIGVETETPQNSVTAEELAQQYGYELDRYLNELKIHKKNIAILDDEHPSDLAYRAARKVIKTSNIPLEKIGRVICTSISRDYITGWTGAVDLAARIGIDNPLCLDLQNGCSGSLLAMHIARQIDPSRPYTLIAGAERWSQTLSTSNIPIGTTAHGDGGGSCLVGPNSDNFFGDLSTYSVAENNGFIFTPAGGTREPIDSSTFQNSRHLRTKRFNRNIVKEYIKSYAQTLNQSLLSNKLQLHDMDFLVMNHMRDSMRASICKAIGVPQEKAISEYKNNGHMGSADLFFSLKSALDGRSGNGRFGLLASSSPSYFGAMPINFSA